MATSDPYPGTTPRPRLKRPTTLNDTESTYEQQTTPLSLQEHQATFQASGFPTPPASACSSTPALTNRSSWQSISTSQDFTDFLARESLSIEYGSDKPGSTCPATPVSIPPDVSDESWARIQEITDRRRAQNLAAQRRYRQRSRASIERRRCPSDASDDESWRLTPAVAHPKPTRGLPLLYLRDDLLQRIYEDNEDLYTDEPGTGSWPQTPLSFDRDDLTSRASPPSTEQSPFTSQRASPDDPGVLQECHLLSLDARTSSYRDGLLSLPAVPEEDASLDLPREQKPNRDEVLSQLIDVSQSYWQTFQASDSILSGPASLPTVASFPDIENQPSVPEVARLNQDPATLGHENTLVYRQSNIVDEPKGTWGDIGQLKRYSHGAASDQQPSHGCRDSLESSSITSMSYDYETATSEDEEVLTDRIDRKGLLLNRLMGYFHSIFETCTPTTRTYGTGGAEGPKSAAVEGTSIGYSLSHGSASVNGSLGVQEAYTRKRLPDDGQDGDDEGDGGRKRHRPDTNTDYPPMRLACPYFKKNPRRYRLSRSCPGPGWTTVHRVKEHLYRCHRLPIHCLYCHDKFESDKILQNHLRAPQRCQVVSLPALEGVDAGQEKLLRSRKKSQKDWSEAEKWKEAYRILFPDDDPAAMPTPYYEYEQNTEVDQDGTATEIARYEQYLKRELPNRVRGALEAKIEQALNPIEETLRDQIVEIVRDSQLHLFESYKKSRAQDLRAEVKGKSKNDDGVESAYDSSPDDAAQSVTTALEDELQPYRPTPYFDQQFDEFNGEFFDLMQLQFCQDWDDSAYGSSILTGTKSPSLDKAGF